MILGIDLGTTHSLAALWQDGKVQLVPNALGDCYTPSCIGMDEDGSILVGKPALSGGYELSDGELDARVRLRRGDW